MTEVEELEARIRNLPEPDFARLREWFLQLDSPQSPDEPAQPPAADPFFEPRDDWERRLRAIALDCGVSLSNEAESSERIYD